MTEIYVTCPKNQNVGSISGTLGLQKIWTYGRDQYVLAVNILKEKSKKVEKVYFPVLRLCPKNSESGVYLLKFWGTGEQNTWTYVISYGEFDSAIKNRKRRRFIRKFWKNLSRGPFSKAVSGRGGSLMSRKLQILAVKSKV